MKERQISGEIQRFLKMVGCAVYSTEQGFRKDRGGTRTSAGIPDLIVLHPDIPGGVLFVELKAERGRLRPSQEGFRAECERCDVCWALWRSVQEAFDYMVGIQVIEEVA